MGLAGPGEQGHLQEADGDGQEGVSEGPGRLQGQYGL